MSTSSLQYAAIEKAAQIIKGADALVIAAGAGMGVDSGLPDFRGNDGFWNAYPALGEERMTFEDIACPLTFYRRPRLAWGFYGHRLALYRATEPHAGFGMLDRWGKTWRTVPLSSPATSACHPAVAAVLVHEGKERDG